MPTCAICSCPLSSPRRKQCGSDQCRLAYAAQKQRAWQRAYAAQTGQSAASRYQSRISARKSNKHCVDCGGPVGWGTSQETRCRKCWDVVIERRPIDRARRKLARAAAGTRGTAVFVGCTCWSCGERFLRKGAVGAVYCSDRCKRRERVARRRAAEKGCKITPGKRHEVFVRDRWLCRICGDPVDRQASVPDPLAPTVDHIVPLAAGGQHAPENWQTAHFYCNSVKRDQIGIEFAEVTAA